MYVYLYIFTSCIDHVYTRAWGGITCEYPKFRKTQRYGHEKRPAYMERDLFT